MGGRVDDVLLREPEHRASSAAASRIIPALRANRSSVTSATFWPPSSTTIARAYSRSCWPIALRARARPAALEHARHGGDVGAADAHPERRGVRGRRRQATGRSRQRGRAHAAAPHRAPPDASASAARGRSRRGRSRGPGDQRRGGAPSIGRVAPAAPEREAAQEAGRECVAAAGRVDDVDRRTRDPRRRRRASTTSAPSAPRWRPRSRRRARAAPGSPRPVVGAGEARAPAPRWAAGSRGAANAGAIQSRIAAACSPGARISAEVTTPCSRAKARILRRLLAAHELGRAEVQVRGSRDRVPWGVAEL